MSHYACAKGRLGTHRTEQPAFNVFMPINLPKPRTIIGIGAVSENELKLFYDKLFADRREHRIVHIIWQTVVISFDKDNVTVKALPVFHQIDGSAVAEIANMYNKVCRLYNRIPFGNKLFFLLLRKHRLSPRTLINLPRPKVVVARHERM